MAIREEIVIGLTLKADNDHMARGLRATKDDINDLNHHSGRLSTAFHGLGQVGRTAMYGIAAGGAAAVASVVALGFSTAKDLADKQRLLKQTEATITSTGGAAHVSSDLIVNMADSLEKLSGVDDQAIQSGENLLLTFTNIRNETGAGNDIFNQASKAMLDMTVAMNDGEVNAENLKTTSIQLGKALQDPIQGATALRRVGVQLSDAQEQQIKQFVEAGDVMSAQKIVLAELNREFGGSAKALGDAQPWNRFKAYVQDGAETLMGWLLPAVNNVFGWLNQNMPHIVEKVKDFADLWKDEGFRAASRDLAETEGALGRIGEILTFAADHWQALTAAAGALGAVLAIVGGPITATVGVIMALAAAVVLLREKWDWLRERFGGVGTVFDGLREKLTAFGNNPIVQAALGAIWDHLKGAVDQARQAIHNLAPAFESIKPHLQLMATIIGAVVVVAIGALSAALHASAWVFNNIMVPAINIAAAVLGGLSGAFMAVVRWVFDHVGPALNWFREHVINPLSPGVQWLGEKATDVKNALVGIATEAKGAVKDSLIWLKDNVIYPLRDAFQAVFEKVEALIGKFGELKESIKDEAWHQLTEALKTSATGGLNLVIPGFAEGGGPFGPNNPRLAVIGEGGQREWVVTESQLRGLGVPHLAEGSPGIAGGNPAGAGASTVKAFADGAAGALGAVQNMVQALTAMVAGSMAKLPPFALDSGAQTGSQFTSGVASTIPVVFGVVDSAVNNITATIRSAQPAAQAGGIALMRIWGDAMQVGSAHPIGIAQRIAAAVKGLFGGSLPSWGPLAQGKSMYDGAIALMQVFGNALLTKADWLKMALVNKLNAWGMGKWIGDAVGDIPSTYSDVFGEIGRLGEKDLFKAFKGRVFSEQHLGLPYLWGGGHPPNESGPFDCSGFASSVNQAMGIPIAGTTYDPFANLMDGIGAITYGLTSDLSHMGIGLLDQWYETGGRAGGTGRTTDYFDLHKVPGGAGGMVPAAFGGDVIGLARQLAAARGWVGGQWDALFQLGQHESGWRPDAVNPSSGAYGVGQINPHSHGYPVAHGDVVGQIMWMLNYISGRYQSPAGAWNFWQQHGWYDKGGINTRPGMFYSGVPEIHLTRRNVNEFLGFDRLADALLKQRKPGRVNNIYGEVHIHNDPDGSIFDQIDDAANRMVDGTVTDGF